MIQGNHDYDDDDEALSMCLCRNLRRKKDDLQ